MVSVPTLRIIYRTTPHPDSKPRPDFFSKELCAQSLLDALAHLETPFTLDVINDSEEVAPAATLLGEGGGKVVVQPSHGNAGSYRQAVSMALAFGEKDFVYFAEDDYLYLPDAFVALMSAVAALPRNVSYFTLYEHPNRWSHGLTRSPWIYLDGLQVWRSIISNCMTFGVRSDVLRGDERLHLKMSQGTHPDDFKLFLALQGGPAVERMLDLPIPKSAAKRRYRLAQALATRRISRRGSKRLVTVCPGLACHLDLTDGLTVGRDWAAVAANVTGHR